MEFHVLINPTKVYLTSVKWQVTGQMIRITEQNVKGQAFKNTQSGGNDLQKNQNIISSVIKQIQRTDLDDDWVALKHLQIWKSMSAITNPWVPKGESIGRGPLWGEQ